MKYEKPEMECIQLNVANIVCTSNGTGDEFQGDAPETWG